MKSISRAVATGAVCALVFGALAFQAAAQAAGAVDPSFGNGGAAIIGGLDAYGPSAMVVRAGGHISYAASRPGFGDVLVGSRTQDGLEDVDFANGGLVPIDVAGGSVSGPVLGFDPVSGATILAATALKSGVYHLLLCRILDDGTFDPTFHLLNYPDQTGCIVTNPPADAPNGLNVTSMSITADGVILLGGTAYNFATAPTFRAFYSSVQSGFVDVAHQVLTVAQNNVFINALAVDDVSDYTFMTGSIQLVDDQSNVDTAILVIKVHSVLGWTYSIIDPNFVPMGYDEGRAIAARPDGKIVIAGTVDIASPVFTDCAVYQVDSDLNLDPGFGDAHNGSIITAFSGGTSDGARCDALAVDASHVYVGGTARIDNDSDRDMAVARLNYDGTFDPGFGIAQSGIAILGPGDSQSLTRFDTVLAMGLQQSRVVVAGPIEPMSGATPENSEMAFVRLGDDEFVFANSFE